MAVRSAVRLRSSRGRLLVKLKNSGTPPRGFTIGNKARKVAVAAVGRSSNTCRRAACGLIASSAIFSDQRACRPIGREVFKSFLLYFFFLCYETLTTLSPAQA